jgi:hypothetical protein
LRPNHDSVSCLGPAAEQAFVPTGFGPRCSGDLPARLWTAAPRALLWKTAEWSVSIGEPQLWCHLSRFRREVAGT